MNKKQIMGLTMNENIKYAKQYATWAADVRMMVEDMDKKGLALSKTMNSSIPNLVFIKLEEAEYWLNRMSESFSEQVKGMIDENIRQEKAHG